MLMLCVRMEILVKLKSVSQACYPMYGCMYVRGANNTIIQ